MFTDTLDLDNFTLTDDQQAALDAFYRFLLSPIEKVFVLRGHSGCGKSTLVRTMMDRLPSFHRAAKLVDPSQPEYEALLTATTNKAAENLSQITGMDVKTIHSALGLRVQTDFKTNTTTLIPRAMPPLGQKLLFIDEASYIDKELLGLVFTRAPECKIVFIGDPAQLAPVKSIGTPVFEANFTGAALTQVVRQAKGNPIVDISTKFRHAVNTGKFFAFRPDGHHIRHMDGETFRKAIEAEFTRPDWRYKDSKILGWTNKCVISYNQFVRNLAKGDPHFQEGDYAVCNSFVTQGKQTIKTDQLVLVTNIEADCERFDVSGNWITVDYTTKCFQPKSLAEKSAAIRKARTNDRLNQVAEMETSWIDLRGAYACTINKAQGSTFGSVFIDLDDVRRCNSIDQIARMLYVGVSRAKNHVYLTGDLA